MTHTASARLDGQFMCETLQAGLLRSTSSPVVCFAVSAGLQTHPVWALGRLAFVTYAYSQTCKGKDVEVCLGGGLLSNTRVSVLIVDHIQWHTSQQVRTSAERLAAELYLQKNLPEQWPMKVLSLPVSNQVEN